MEFSFPCTKREGAQSSPPTSLIISKLKSASYLSPALFGISRQQLVHFLSEAAIKNKL
jgi:hypothetical protein